MEESSLLCHENESSCFSGDDDECCETELESIALLGFEDEEEYIVSLLRREGESESESEASVSRPPPLEQSVRSSWCGRTRLDSVDWILDARAFLGFQYHTAYLAVTYLDRFLARRSISDEKLWAMRLLSVACLSLAAKMEECHVPALSDFPSQIYKFEGSVITRMELLVLTTLDWQMAAITPFSYINFFIDKLLGKTSNSKVFLSAAVELVLAALKEINLVEYRPSTIAAAAVLASSSGQLTRKVVELKLGVISSRGSFVTEHVFSCYNIMQEIQKKEREKTPKERITSPMANTSRSSSYGSANGNKRRRLLFNDNDDDLSFPLKKHTDRQ